MNRKMTRLAFAREVRRLRRQRIGRCRRRGGEQAGVGEDTGQARAPKPPPMRHSTSRRERIRADHGPGAIADSIACKLASGDFRYSTASERNP